jgi:hypothetical protein
VTIYNHDPGEGRVTIPPGTAPTEIIANLGVGTAARLGVPAIARPLITPRAASLGPESI